MSEKKPSSWKVPGKNPWKLETAGKKLCRKMKEKSLAMFKK